MKLFSYSKVIPYILFALFGVLYLTSSRGVTYCNDGSQMALVKAIAEEGSFSINSFVEYTKKVDYAYREGNYFSDRSVGASLIAVPFYKAVFLASTALHYSPSEVLQYSEEAAIISLALYGALGVVFLYLTLLSLNLSISASFLTVCVYGAASLHWKYSALFMSHGPSATTTILILWLLFKNNPNRFCIPLFFLMGFLPLIRYEAGLLIPFFLLLWTIRGEGKWYLLRFNCTSQLLAALLSLTVPLVFLVYYQTSCFGGPLETFAKFYAPDRNFFGNEPVYEKAGGGFSPSDILYHPFWDGMRKIFFQFPGTATLPTALQAVVGRGAWGILILQPVLVFALFGAILFIYQRKKEGLILFGAFAATASFIALLWVQDGGGMRDARFILMSLPILYLFLGIWVEFVHKNSSRAFSSIASAFFWILASMSFLMTCLHFIETDERHPGFSYSLISAPSLISREFFQEILNNVFVRRIDPSFSIVLAVTATLGVSFCILLLSRIPRSLVVISAFFILSLLSLRVWSLTSLKHSELRRGTIEISDRPARLAVQEIGFPKRIHSSGHTNRLSCSSYIEVQPHSVILIPLSGKEREFSTSIKIRPSNHKLNRSKMNFILRANNKVLWNSGRVGFGAPLQFVSIPIQSSKYLTLEVKLYPGRRGDLALWCNPQLFKTMTKW